MGKVIIDISKFGNILISRPNGREAALIMLSSFKPTNDQDAIELDFSQVDVVAPSWLDEVLTALSKAYGSKRIKCSPDTNVTLQESLKVIDLD